MVARSKGTRVVRVVLTLTLFALMLCQGPPVLAQEGTGGAPPPSAARASARRSWTRHRELGAGTPQQYHLQPVRHRRLHPAGGWQRGLQLRLRGRTAGRAADLPEERDPRRRPCRGHRSVATSYTYNGNGTIPTGAPAPTGGPITAAEAALQGNAQFPAPLIYAAVGDVVEIRLKNLGVTAAHRAQRPAQHPPARPGCGRGQRRRAGDLGGRHPGQPDACTPGAGNVVVYMFSPKFPGTYMYHCHQEADIHVQMGMYGALVVYNRRRCCGSDRPRHGQGRHPVRLEVRQGLRAAGVRDWRGPARLRRDQRATTTRWTTTRRTGSSTACRSPTPSMWACLGPTGGATGSRRIRATTRSSPAASAQERQRS